MRLHVVLIVALALAPSFVTATKQEAEDTLAVSVVRSEGEGVYVSWTSAPGSVMYEVWRGTTLESMALVATTPLVEYTDLAPLDADSWYRIVSQVADEIPYDLAGPMRGKCLALRGTTGVSVTITHCIPGRIP